MSAARSREIPRWLLAALLALAVLAITTFAPGAQAAMDCQAAGYFVTQNYDRQTFWTNCGFWYEEALPYMPPIAEPPVVNSTTPVPEPASWMLFAAGGIVCAVVARRRSASARKGQLS